MIRILKTAVIVIFGVGFSNYSSAFMQSGSKMNPPVEELNRDYKEFQLSFHGSMYKTRDNFSSNRLEESLPPGNAYTLFKETTSASFGFNENLSLFINADFGYSEMKTPLYTNTNSSFGDSELGLRWFPKFEFLNFMFEFGSVLPLYARGSADQWSTVGRETSSVVGNGTVEPWVFFSPEFNLGNNFWLELGGGAKYRSSGFSNLYLANISLEYKTPKNFFMRLSAKYFDTAMEDQYSNQTLNCERSTQRMGGSLLFNSINPTLLAASLSTGYYLGEKSFISAEYSQDIWGKNTSSGFSASLGLGFHFGHDDRMSTLPLKKSEPFRQYSTSARIIRLNQKMNLITIDKGSSYGFKNGEVLHIFKVDSTTDPSDYGNFITSARIIDVESSRSTLQIVDIYDLNQIKEGFVVRKPLH